MPCVRGAVFLRWFVGSLLSLAALPASLLTAWALNKWGVYSMKYQAGRYHVLTWCYSSGEDSKGDFSTKTRALQDMRQRVKMDGYDGAAVIDRCTRQVVAVYGDFPRFSVF